jgi:hypothetical protein
MSLRGRLRRLQQKAEEGGVVISQQDGTLKAFEVMEVQAQMFLARADLWRNTATDSEVVAAVRSATPESRAEFEERFGPIVMTNYVIASESQGGWVESKTLTEDGRVERILYEGDSEEATLVHEGVRGSPLRPEIPELPRPLLAGRWVGEPDEDLSE